VTPEEAEDPAAEDGDPLPPGPALITPEDVQAIEKLPQGDVVPSEVDPRQFDVPIVLNDQVRTFIHYFSNRKYDLIHRAFERASRYLPMMRPIFREKGVPDELLNLAFIESAFNPRAHSRARATGIWQFIEGTGRRFGMRSGFWVDERRDPELSTRGAAEYLKSLYGMFESWPLALAAYNAGEGKIQQAIARQKTTDFWRLRLPKETQLFVPAFMAMTIIAKDPARYGFAPSPEQIPETDTVVLSESVDLRILARAAQTTPEVLRDLNPMLVRGATPPGPFSLRLPAGSGEGFQERLAQIPRPKRALSAQHRVRKGETWASIARRHRMAASALLELNGRSTMGPLKVGSTILVPGRGAALAEAPVPAPSSRAAAAALPASPRRYTVKRGDTLDKIAGAHGVRVKDLVAWNGLRGRRPLKPGKILVIHTGQAEARGAAGAAPGGAKPRQIRYTVKEGDTLGDIAQTHGVRPEELRRWNGLTGRRQLQPGQELRILLPETS
jgi:membrane-bound lytic murein transglycosylase D